MLKINANKNVLKMNANGQIHRQTEHFPTNLEIVLFVCLPVHLHSSSRKCFSNDLMLIPIIKVHYNIFRIENDVHMRQFFCI